MSSSDSGALMEQELVDFLTSHLPIHVAACSPQRHSTLVKAPGCRINAARTQITVLVPRYQSEALLRAVETTGKVAVVFCQPETHRTIQLKGTDAVIGEATDADRNMLGPYLKKLSERLAYYAVSEVYTHTLYGCDPNELVTITFTPESAFRQTPGQHAGDKIKLGAPLP